MAEFPALQAAQNFALQSDAKVQRELLEQNRARVEALRQAGIDTRNAAAGEEIRKKTLQLERQRQDIREADLARARERQAQVAREGEIKEQRRLIDEKDARDFALKSNAAEALDRQFVLRRQFDNEIQANFQPAPRLVPLPGPDDSGAAQAAGIAGVAEAPLTPEQIRLDNFALLEAERDARIAERRQDTRDRLIQQQLDLQLAEDRINSVPPRPDLPRGSIVDVVG
jgi:hypothetical protein